MEKNEIIKMVENMGFTLVKDRSNGSVWPETLPNDPSYNQFKYLIFKSKTTNKEFLWDMNESIEKNMGKCVKLI